MGNKIFKLGVILCCILQYASLHGQIPQFQFRAETGTGTYELLDGTGVFDSSLLVRQLPGTPAPTQGISIGSTHDSSLLQVTSVSSSGSIALLNGGAGPDFFASNIYGDGFTMVAVFSFDSSVTIDFTTEQAVAVASYSLIPSALVGILDGATATLSFSDTVGSPGAPVVENIVTVAGQSSVPECIPGVITLTPTISVGDCDGNLVLDADEIAADPSLDCNLNGFLDDCDLVQGYDTDMNNDGVPDSCECNFPNQLTCTRIPGELLIELTWGDSSSPVQLFRDGVLIASLIDGQTSYIDDGLPCSCSVDYMIQKECDNAQIATETCTFDWLEQHPDFGFNYSAESVDQNYTLVQGGAPTVVAVDLFIEGTVAQGSPCAPAATHGYSMSMSHDPTLLSVMDLELAGEMLSVSPDYVSFAIGNDNTANSSGDVGWCMGVLYSLDPVGGGVPGGPALETVTYETRKLVARVTYEAACGDWQNSGVTDLQFEGLALNDSSPPIDNVVGVCGVVYAPVLATPSAQVEIIKGPEQPLFIRGDCSNQGSINIQDAVLMLNYLFSSTEITCADACDADDDGLLNLVDPLFDLMFIMGLGPMPPAPAGVCGADPSPDSLSCEISVGNNCEDLCPFEDCSNGMDDDGDGLVDCSDLDCQGTSSCP